MSNLPAHQSFTDPDELNKNPTSNALLQDIVSQRYSRRSLIKTFGVATVAVFGGASLTGCDEDTDEVVNTTPTTPSLLTFNAVAKSLKDRVVVPKGYTATIIYALGDSLKSSTADYKNDGTDTDYENRAGDHHDGMVYYGVNSANKYDPTSSTRGVLAINHEATTDDVRTSYFLHANGGTQALPRPASEVDKELAIHGLSFVEVKNTNGEWSYVKASPLNGRVHMNTEVEIAGPLKGHDLLKTKYSSTATVTRGTLNNCGSNRTPWGTYVSGEENWAGYFVRTSADSTADTNRNVLMSRYGVPSASRHGWESAGTADKYVRFILDATGATATDDYRNEINGFGYIVEADPVNRSKKIKKRTALGRFAHESAAFSIPTQGKKLAVYMGDDSRFEYIYKFVTDATWSNADANSTDPLATGDKYLDNGVLYAAEFKADGTGTWHPLTVSNQKVKDYATFTFANNAAIALNTRSAADAVGATKMDRPEWCTVHPTTGEVYFTLTNNTKRTEGDAANPRVYSDFKAGKESKGNVNGHIIRIKEGNEGSTATTFTWDIYLFGAQSDHDATNVNVSALTDDQDFSSPDGLAFSETSNGLLWIQTDDGAYTDETNCMMLAAVPGKLGDGTTSTVNGITTYVGAKAAESTLKRFLVGPKDCELTGITETPDGKALFVNIQHPGENTGLVNISNPLAYTSQWPSNAGYGAGKRPRSATIVITKDDGGKVGS